MTPRRDSPAPFWFQLLVAAALALAARELDVWLTPSGVRGDDGPPVLMAFWAAIALVAGWVWNGIQAAGNAILIGLQASVTLLWSFARSIYAGAKFIGRQVATGLHKTWDFFEATYDKVLKPAWDKLWSWYEKAKKWLEDTFGPVLRFIDGMLTEIEKFYDKWVKPWVDILSITRKVLRVLQSLGLDWAKKLDAQLIQIQDWINRPFQEVIGFLNEIARQVNRIMTVDGLVQRFAMIRSIERDIREVSRAFANWRDAPLSESDWEDLRARANDRTPAQAAAEFSALVERRAGPLGPLVTEMASSWRIRLEASR